MEDLGHWVPRAQSGDREAMEKLLSALAPSIHRFGLRMCGNAHDADDVLQDTLLSVVNNLGSFEGRSSLSSWAFALTRSACSRRRRGLKNRPPASDERLAREVDRAPSPEARAADRELAAVLTGALDRLSDEHREVILLRDVEGLTAPEAASALGVTVDALKSRLHRAREALRAELKAALEPAGPGPTPSCPDVVLMWSRKLEGDLSPVDCASMEQHIERCSACGGACEALRTALVACRSVRSTSVPPEVKARVEVAVRAFRDRTRR